MSSNRLVIDVGNTSIATALFVDGEIISPTRILTSNIEQVSDVQQLLTQGSSNELLGETEIVMCVGVTRVRDLFEKYAQINSSKIHFVSGSNLAGAKIQYETTLTLGPDRIANAIAAVNVSTQPTLVVDCGTAINIDLIDNNGRFIGGMICPGPETSRDALVHFAPSLPEVPLDPPEQLIGTSTISCIQSGILYGSAAMIDSVFEQLEKNYLGLKMVVTGGFSSTIFPLLKTEAIHDEWLTLKGLGFAQI